MAVTLGNAFGSTIAFGTNTTFAPYITNISLDGVERGDTDTSYLGMTPHGATTDVTAIRSFVPGGLADPGTLTLGILGNMVAANIGITAEGTSTCAMIAKTSEIITLTFANTGGSSDATFAFTGYVKSLGNLAGDAETGWSGQMILKVGGPITFTAAT